jgi:hypothetical protein
VRCLLLAIVARRAFIGQASDVWNWFAWSGAGTVTLTSRSVIVFEDIRKWRYDPGASSLLCYHLRPGNVVPEEESSSALFFVGGRS